MRGKDIRLIGTREAHNILAGKTERKSYLRNPGVEGRVGFASVEWIQLAQYAVGRRVLVSTEINLLVP
jgi:hypothetical protein